MQKLMKVKSFIQIIIIILLIILSFSFVYNFNKEKVNLFNYKNLEIDKENLKRMDSESSDQMINLNYKSKNLNGDIFEISADTGRIDKNNNNIIFMNNVEAKITINQSENIKINSLTATYNLDNYSSIFRDNIVVLYKDYQLNSEILELDFINNKVIFFDNILHSFSNNGKIKAAVIKFNSINKKFEFLSDDNTKVIVTNNINNGNN